MPPLADARGKRCACGMGGSEVKLEAGRYYLDADGKKVGPILYDDQGFNYVGSEYFFEENGRSIFGDDPHLVAEWTDTPSPRLAEDNPTSAAAFANIVHALNDAVAAMLEDCNFDKAIECAIMMRECERMRDDLDGDTGDNIADAVRRCVEDGIL